MMIDDDPAICKIAELSLTRVGKWHVVLADSGIKALEMIGGCKPDVILLDIMMPGMDGQTTLKKLRELLRETLPPVILMTAKVQKHDVQSYYQLGVAGVIIKPFDPLNLPQNIQNILSNEIKEACIA
jgi:CheY-like chemotaxis protein